MSDKETEYLCKLLERAAGRLSKSERKKIINNLLDTGKFSVEQIAHMTDKEILVQSYIEEKNYYCIE